MPVTPLHAHLLHHIQKPMEVLVAALTSYVAFVTCDTHNSTTSAKELGECRNRLYSGTRCVTQCS